jgi:hypothetical protein
MAENTQDSNQSNIRPGFNVATRGLNLDSTLNQLPKGSLTYALNASIENFDESSINYQNEPGNEPCFDFPEGYQVIGRYSIIEQSKHIFFLANPITEDSEIGYVINNDCVYRTLVNAKCLNFDINYPILKVVHKITSCGTEIYWPDQNARRYLDIDNIPYIQSSISEPCDLKYTKELDCNAINIQPDFSIPQLRVTDINIGGNLIAGTYQFAIQYSDVNGDGYSSYYSVTNPTPIHDPQITTPNFNYNVGKSIAVTISNLDVSGQWQYFNLAVIKTINAITSVELIGTYFIDDVEQTITYTGQNVSAIRLTQDDIFEKFPYYEIAQDLTAVRDVLVWDGLTSIDRINYQQIASQITLQWETYRIPSTESYADELNATNLRGYMRDEVYAFEIVFLLTNGKQTDGFHIPGRTANANDLVPIYPTNADFIGEPDDVTGTSPTWKIYNTGSVEGFSQGYLTNSDYKGPYQYGEFSYWESIENYPCNKEVWGNLANTPIRHHKFPDVSISPIFESALFSSGADLVMQEDAIYPIGVKIDISQITSLINSSNLTSTQKAAIAGFKIVRGDRGTNKSIVAKGILRNVGEYKREGTTYYYPNYPYNDLRQDPFLLTNSNAYTSNSNTSGNISCRNFTVTVTALDAIANEFVVEYIDCYTNTITRKTSTTVGEVLDICSLSFPAPSVILGTACVAFNTYKTYKITVTQGMGFVDFSVNYPTTVCNGTFNPSTVSVSVFTPKTFNSTSYPVFTNTLDAEYIIEELAAIGYDICVPPNLDGFSTNASKYRQVFNSPDTSFGQPFLGNVLKLENVIFGAGQSHFVQVKRNALYKLISREAQLDALESADNIANITVDYNASALFAAYQSYLTIYVNGITRRNYAYSFNSIASYDYSDVINNAVVGLDGFIGVKQRKIETAQYLIPGVQSAGDNNNINNYQRESSVYLKTSDEVRLYDKVYNTYRICNTNLVPNSQTFQYTDLSESLVTTSAITQGTCINVDSFTFPTLVTGNNLFTITSIATGTQTENVPTPPLPFPNKTPSLAPSGTSIINDDSRFILSDDRGDCNAPEQNVRINVVSYYASIKNIFDNQWGQIYSYETIDTGFQRSISPATSPIFDTIFGGDTFINKFAFKTKLPFFIDNRVGAPDDSDIYYDEIGNLAYPKYWFSARSVLSNASVSSNINLTNFISIKAHNLDCPNSQTPKTNPGRTYYDGKMYLFAYGIPYFYCESSYNVDLRQAFNNREGDFWPHVSTSIPDDWVQESYVSIANDNTYYYNTTFSKQNRENFFSHLPIDWTPEICFTFFPFRAIYSDEQVSFVDNPVNNWLVYRPVSFFDFPQNYGKLTSLDGIQNKAVLARFENKSLLYNTLLTIDTSNPKAAYVGNSKLFSESPAIDFAETDLGYVGSQHKMLLKIPQGQVTIDAKRGQVFLIGGDKAQDLSAFGSGLNKFFTNHLAFEILKYFPNVNVDNHFAGLGLHGVFDSRYDRIIITKLDYIPKDKNISYNDIDKKFYLTRKLSGGQELTEEVYLTDLDYFCNKSWTLSFNLNTNSWISFHSYIPNWYIAENNFFYSGLNDCCSTIDAVVATVLPEPSTTTTTSSSTTTTSSTSTTTTTTTAFTGCNISGVATELYCDLLGTAVNIETNLYCVGVILDSYTCCDAIDAYNNEGCPTAPFPSSAYFYSNCSSLSLGCIMYSDAELLYPITGLSRWIYDGENCWFMDSTGTITEEGTCTTTTTTTSPL